MKICFSSFLFQVQGWIRMLILFFFVFYDLFYISFMKLVVLCLASRRAMLLTFYFQSSNALAHTTTDTISEVSLCSIRRRRYVYDYLNASMCWMLFFCINTSISMGKNSKLSLLVLLFHYVDGGSAQPDNAAANEWELSPNRLMLWGLLVVIWIPR